MSHERSAAAHMARAEDAPAAGVRQWIDRFIARHSLAWEITFAILSEGRRLTLVARGPRGAALLAAVGTL